MYAVALLGPFYSQMLELSMHVVKTTKTGNVQSNLVIRNKLVLRNKRNLYKDLIVVIACLVVGVSCFLLLECVIKVTRKELLE